MTLLPVAVFGVMLAVATLSFHQMEHLPALLFIAPVVVSAATLDAVSTVLLGGLSFIAIVFLANAHLPLPWFPDQTFSLPPLYRFGIGVSLILGVGFTSMYAWRTANEAARMSAALAATQLALAVISNRKDVHTGVILLAAGRLPPGGAPTGRLVASVCRCLVEREKAITSLLPTSRTNNWPPESASP